MAKHLKHLRKITIAYVYRQTVKLSLRDDAGLVASFSMDEHATSYTRGDKRIAQRRAKKAKYEKDVDRGCKFAGIKNQTLVLALTSNTTL